MPESSNLLEPEWRRLHQSCWALPVEEIGYQLDNTRNMSGTTVKNNFIHVRFINLRISEDLLEGASEEILPELLEAGTAK